jgi:hypothetical protein
VAVALTVGALANVSFVLRRLKFYSTLMEVLNLEDVLVGGGRLQVHKVHGEVEFDAILRNVPNIGVLMAEVLNLCFNVGGIDGVVHVFQHYPVVAFFLRLICMKFCIFVGQGFDNFSVRVRNFWLNFDLVLGEGFGFMGSGYGLFQQLQKRETGNILGVDWRRFGDV